MYQSFGAGNKVTVLLAISTWSITVRNWRICYGLLWCLVNSNSNKNKTDGDDGDDDDFGGDDDDDDCVVLMMMMMMMIIMMMIYGKQMFWLAELLLAWRLCCKYKRIALPRKGFRRWRCASCDQTISYLCKFAHTFNVIYFGSIFH